MPPPSVAGRPRYCSAQSMMLRSGRGARSRRISRASISAARRTSSGSSIVSRLGAIIGLFRLFRLGLAFDLVGHHDHARAELAYELEQREPNLLGVATAGRQPRGPG